MWLVLLICGSNNMQAEPVCSLFKPCVYIYCWFVYMKIQKRNRVVLFHAAVFKYNTSTSSQIQTVFVK